MKSASFLTTTVLAAVFLCSCSSTASPTNVPPDHIVNKGGILHKSGLENPEYNCVECHGSDLRGGTSGVSCYQCHGKKW
jgi:hypothetical protein